MANILTSWKEIGQYLGKGVRTVQRWERDGGLPVRRQMGRSRHAVLAVPEELDAWARSRTRGPSAAVADELRREIAELRAENVELRERLDRIEAAASGGFRFFPLSRPSDGLRDRSHSIWLDAQRCRGESIRTRLSAASTLCDLAPGRTHDRNRSLQRARKSAADVHRSLEVEGYVPREELGELLAALMKLSQKIEFVARVVEAGGDGGAISCGDSPELVN